MLLLFAGLALIATDAGAQDVSVGQGGVTAPGVRVDRNGVRVRTGQTAKAKTTARTRTTATGNSRVVAGSGAAVAVIGDGSIREVDCHGDGLRVEGNGNILTAMNCSGLSLTGDGNNITVGFTGSGRLTVQGNGNDVTWSAPRGISVSASSSGSGNMVNRR